MNDKLEAMIAKAAEEKDLKKRAVSLRDEGDLILDDMAKAYAKENGVSYLEAYGHVTTMDGLGVKVLKHREEASRFIESQTAIN